MRRNAEIQERKDSTDIQNARKDHRMKDMRIKQERKDDRKSEGQTYIHNVMFHDAKASKSGNFSQFFRIGGPEDLVPFLDFPGRAGVFRIGRPGDLVSFLNFQVKGNLGLGTWDLS